MQFWRTWIVCLAAQISDGSKPSLGVKHQPRRPRNQTKNLILLRLTLTHAVHCKLAKLREVHRDESEVKRSSEVELSADGRGRIIGTNWINGTDVGMLTCMGTEKSALLIQDAELLGTGLAIWQQPCAHCGDVHVCSLNGRNCNLIFMLQKRFDPLGRILQNSPAF